MSIEKFFQNRKLWSKRKHRLLGNYLTPFMAKLAKTTSSRRVFIVDGFAGQARYDDGTDGSPLLIAKLADSAMGRSDPVSLRLIDVEPDAPTFEVLERSTKEWKESGVVTNINKHFRDALPNILTEVGNSPALFFLDPYGPTFIHFVDLLPILRRNSGVTELIVNFDTDGLYRIARGALSPNTDLKTAITFGDQVSKIIGNNTWKDVLKNSSMNTQEGEDYLLDQYLKNIRRHMTFAFAYPIREALDKRPKYHFVFCTRHSDGLVLMNDFVRHEDDLIYGEHIETSSPLFQNLDLGGQAVQTRRLMLRTVMYDYFRENQMIIRSQMIPQLVTAHFGEFDEKDYRSVFGDYVKGGQLVADDKSTGIDLRRYQLAVGNQ